MSTFVGWETPESGAVNTTSTSYENDDRFGPFLQGTGRSLFDFTMLFEETILSILPSALLLLLIPLRLLRLRKAPRKVMSSNFRAIKSVLLAVFSGFQIVHVIQVSRTSSRTSASLAAAAVALAASLGLWILSHVEHMKNIRPSSIINGYLSVSLLLDSAQLRTNWQREKSLPTNAVATTTMAIKLLVLVSEAVEKKSLIFETYKDVSPEATSGLYSRGAFWWLNPLLRLGFKNDIKNDDLFTIDRDMRSETLRLRFRKQWLNKAKYPSKHRLAWVMLRVMLLPLSSAIFPRLALTFFSFMQPLLLRSLTNLVSKPDSSYATERGWGLVAATGLVYIGLALTRGAYQHKSNRMATMVRGSLVSAIYTHVLDLPITSLDESAAVTLMSSDVERICDAMLDIHSLWSSPLEISLAIWLLQKQIGLALLGPLVVTSIALTGTFIISRHMGKAQKDWIETIQTRIDATAKIIHAMKGVKMLGLHSRTSRILRQLRVDEVTKSLKMRKLFVGMIAFGNISDIFAAGTAFAIYVAEASVNGQVLNVTSAFTTLSLIALLMAPIRAIVFAIPPLRAALSCFDRIDSFLSSPTKRDHRILVSSALEEQSRVIGSYESDVNTNNPFDIELQEMTSPSNDVSLPVAIRIRNLTLAWSDEHSPVIDNVTIDFQHGHLTMIVGPVGCGKSSLLKGLIGEVPSSKGNVYVSRTHAAYVDQISWIQNGTIRENIVGSSEFDARWYSAVLNTCSLDADIEALHEGDSTKVGSSGAALSGGQRLRVALARAVYSRHNVLVLDDIFSGLDPLAEELIFSRLLGRNGMLRRLGCTVILATHAAHRLSYADEIVVLNDQGTISEQGSYKSLVMSSGYVAGLVARHKSEKEDAPLEEIPPPKDETGAGNSVAAAPKYTVASWAIYDYYFAGVGRPTVLLWSILLITYSILLRFPDILIKFWTGAIARHGNSVNGLYLGVLIGLEVLAMTTLMIVAALLFVTMIPRSAKYFHGRLLTTVENAPLSFFTSTDTGQIVNRFSQDLSVIDSELPLAGLILANNVCVAAIQAIFICISAPYFAAVLPFVLFLTYILQMFYLRTSRQIRIMDLEAKAPLSSLFLETLSGLATIRAFGWTKGIEKQNRRLLDTSQKPFYLLFCVQRWLALVVDLSVAALAVILVALIVKFRHSSDAGFVGVALINIMTFNTTLSVVIQHWTAIETSLGAISRIKAFSEETACENLPQECFAVQAAWPSEGCVVISDLSASYAPGQETVLRNLNLVISSGQKIGICGPSGSGKSSLVAVLLHLLEISGGFIAIDGVDITNIPRNVLRNRLTVIPQDPLFLKGTIRENLDPFDLEDAARLEDVLKRVGLWTIVNNAGGVDMPMVAEELLSHGQRQLFCLARAMLNTSKIVIIDEATASVDLQTDDLMQEIIEDNFAHCTVIAVAHRLQTIRNYDSIVVFERGRIVEYGEPGALLADACSKFKKLWDA